MDLKTQDEEKIETVIDILTGKSHFKEIVCRGELKSFYAQNIYPEYEDLIIEKEPTYYRKGSGLARDYAYRSNNPVIVFLDPEIRKEDVFYEYTGMGTDLFLTQVINNEIIPTRGLWKEYEGNDFYKKFFDKWETSGELDKKPPVFANIIESCLSGEDFWRATATELEKKFPFLEKRRVKPVPELKSSDAVRFFAERISYLELIGMNDLAGDVKNLLKEYKSTQESDKLRNAEMIIFYAHQIFSAKSFYSFGSTVTFSNTDYRTATEKIKEMWEKRDERNKLGKTLIRMCMPLSSYISNAKKSLGFSIPEKNTCENKKVYEEFYEKFYENTSDCREEATSAENQCIDYLRDLPHIGIDLLDDSREKLVECVDGYRESLLDSVAKPHKWLGTVFEIGSTISIEPATSLSNLILSPDIFSAINEYCKTKRELNYLNQNILPSTGTKISVWETGKTEFKEVL